MSTNDTFRQDTSLATRPSRNRSSFSLLSAVEWLEHRVEKRRSRHALRDMTDAQLKDIGLSRTDAYRESIRPFWK